MTPDFIHYRMQRFLNMTQGDIEKIFDDVEHKVRETIRTKGYAHTNNPYELAESVGIDRPILDADFRNGILSVTILP